MAKFGVRDAQIQGTVEKSKTKFLWLKLFSIYLIIAEFNAVYNH